MPTTRTPLAVWVVEWKPRCWQSLHLDLFKVYLFSSPTCAVWYCKWQDKHRLLSTWSALVTSEWLHSCNRWHWTHESYDTLEQSRDLLALAGIAKLCLPYGVCLHTPPHLDSMVSHRSAHFLRQQLGLATVLDFLAWKITIGETLMTFLLSRLPFALSTEAQWTMAACVWYITKAVKPLVAQVKTASAPLLINLKNELQNCHTAICQAD